VVPKRGGAALAPKAEVVWEPKGDLTSVGAVVPNVGGFAVCCPKRGFDSGGAVVVPKVKGDLDSVGADGFTLACCPKRGLDSVGAVFVPKLLVTAPNDGKAFASVRFGVAGRSSFTGNALPNPPPPNPDKLGAVVVGAGAGPGEKAVVTGGAEGGRGFVIGAPADDMAVAGENRFLGAGGLKPDENPLVVVLSCFVPPKVKG